jgi:arsenate reductase
MTDVKVILIWACLLAAPAVGQEADTARIEGLTGAKGAPDTASHERRAAAGDVVFVCEHGSVKSVIAGEWFNRLAAERGIKARAVARGVTVDAAVPPGVAAALQRDGFDVRGFTPREVRPDELSAASRVVSFGATLPPSNAAVTTWSGVPPASERYEEARNDIRSRVEALLAELENGE